MMRDQTAFIVPEFWDAATCARLRAAIDGGSATPAEIFDGGFIVDAGVRRALDVEPGVEAIAVADAALAAVRDRVAAHFGTTLTAAEGAGFLRYAPGGFYAAHTDALEHGGFERRISVVVFLSAVTGGELRLHLPAGPEDCRPVPGTLVAFPSGTLHEVLPVIEGVRDVVVDWFY